MDDFAGGTKFVHVDHDQPTWVNTFIGNTVIALENLTFV